MRERIVAQFEAVYEDGVLRPLNPIDLPENERLPLTVSNLIDPLADVWTGTPTSLPQFRGRQRNA
jgi:predicted DNA-binding antitoxin AbrB/MazE fold protein